MNKLFPLVLLVFSLFFTANAQTGVNKLFLELHNGNFWETPATLTSNPIRNSNSILGFRLMNGTVYSTGVNDAMLASQGVSFTPAFFRSLPVEDVYFAPYGQPVNGNVYFGFPADLDGNPTVALTPPFTFPDYKISIPLMSGSKGLDIGSIVTNVPSTTLLTFDIVNPVQFGSINDMVPDIIITQEAQTGSSDAVDELWFEDATGNMIGNRVQVIVASNTSYPQLGQTYYDFYHIRPGTPAWESNSPRFFKMFSVRLEEFGLNASNYEDIRKLKYKFNGSSDPGVIAYNENSFRFVPLIAVDDTATTDRDTPITINVLGNDSYDSTDIPVVTLLSSPAHGSVSIVGNEVLYTPDFSFTGGTVSFIYRICDSFGCDEATVTITIRNVCQKLPNLDPADSFTKIGISTMSGVDKQWPETQIPNGFLALESDTKGMVITRSVSSIIQNPVEGMIIYDTADRCVKLYSVNASNVGSWNCINQICKE